MKAIFKRFETMVDPFVDGPAGTPPDTYWAYLLQQVATLRPAIPGLLISGLLVACIDAYLIFYGGRLIDQMEAAGVEHFFVRHGWEIAFMALYVALIRPGFITWQRFYLEQVVAGTMQDQTRWRAHRHMLGQPMSFFQGDFAGRLANRVMQLGTATEDTVYMLFEAIWYFLAFIVTSSIVLAQMDARLVIPVAIWVVIYGFYVYWIARRVGEASEKWSAARSMVTGRVVDSYTNIETVKLFAHSEREERYALSAMKRHRLRWWRFLRLMTELSFGLNIIVGILFVGVLGPALFFWQGGSMTTGEVAAALALLVRMNGVCGWIMWIGIQLFNQAGTIMESLQSVSVPQTVVDAPGAPALAVPAGEIRFEDVSHHYGRSSGGLDHVSLTIKAGEKVGLVGRSGAGKSSLVNLALRMRDTEEGRILIDGQNIAEVSQGSLRAQIGMVTQDSSLLHRSVRANILYGRPSASEAQMIEAATRAEAHDFIGDLRDPKGRAGYDAHVGERGVKLSGGQRQRVAIARVILKDAPILILDEATSALDSEVEAAIQETLYGMMEGKTVIAIAHRLSTIARMDRIIVMDDGRIAEEGTHDALLDRGGLYASFWARQSGGFLKTEETAA